MVNGIPNRRSDGWSIPLAEGTITQIAIDHALGISIWVDTQTQIRLRIEAPFLFGADARLVAWKSGTELGEFASLLGGVVDRIELSDSGELGLPFRDGRSITIKPDDSYEAYQLESKFKAQGDGFLFVCEPGGGLAVWFTENN